MNLPYSMQNRRTIRRYRPDDVPSDLLRQLLQTACRAATCGGMQCYSIIVTRSPEGKKALAPAHYGQPMVTQAPVVLTFCIDLRRFSQWCRQREADPGYDNLQWFVTGAADTLLACQTFCTAAEDQGLGTCYLGTTTYNPDLIIEALHLPPLVFPLATITLGWPDESPALTPRLPLDYVVHEETYHDPSQAQIDACYAGLEALPESQQYVEENHVDNLAQVFTRVRYTREGAEAASRTLLKMMRQQGFLSANSED